MKITVILLLLLFLLLNQRLFSQERNHIQWTFEPRTDRSVHIEAVVTLMESTDSYTFLEVPGEIWVKNVRAYEYESETPIKHEVHYDNKTRKQTITLIFNQPVPEPFVFGIKFDLADFMEEKKEKVFIFEWWYMSEKEYTHTGVVFLPKGAELLDLQHLEPVRMEEGERIIICYERKPTGYSDFNFLLAFSSSGKDYVKLAEHYEGKKDYNLASSYYKRATSFYGRHRFFAEANPEFLRELSQKTLAIQKIHADDTFEEATEAFEKEEYEKAKLQFEKAEPLYRVLKDTEKEFQCREMITECEKILLEKEAETLLEQGKTQYESENYTMAKKSFIRARTKFEELGDTEKVSECEKWSDKVEEVYQIILVCTGGAAAFSLILWQRFREKYGGGLHCYKDLFKALLVCWCVLLFGLGIFFYSIFLEIVVLLVYCFFTAWVGSQYKGYILRSSHSLGDCFTAFGVTLLAVSCIFFLGMGIMFLFESTLILTVFFVIFSFFLWVFYYFYKMWVVWGCWGLFFKEIFRK